MVYKTVAIDYAPKAKKMANAIEEKANEMLKEGYELVTMSITNSAKAILVFKGEEQMQKETVIEEVTEVEQEVNE